MKGCGCKRDGLTCNVTIWECWGCGELQGARYRRCRGCNRSKPKHISPHPEHHYYAPNGERGSFTDRAGVERCSGCLAPENQAEAKA
jgi:hypothetical protein